MVYQALIGATLSNLLSGGKKRPHYTTGRRWEEMASVLGSGGAWDANMLGPLLEQLSQMKGSGGRFLENAMEYFSHPGAAQALQGALGFGQMAANMPNPYGAGWQSALRRQVSQGVGAGVAQGREAMTRALGQRGIYGAADQTGLAQLGAGAGRAQADALTGLGTMFADKASQWWQQRFQNIAAANQMLQGLVLGQPSYPIFQEQQGQSTWEKLLPFLTQMGGVGMMLPFLKR